MLVRISFGLMIKMALKMEKGAQPDNLYQMSCMVWFEQMNHFVCILFIHVTFCKLVGAARNFPSPFWFQLLSYFSVLFLMVLGVISVLYFTASLYCKRLWKRTWLLFFLECRVLLCLKRALRIANAAQQMANIARGISGPVILFIEILNKSVALSFTKFNLSWHIPFALTLLFSFFYWVSGLPWIDPIRTVLLLVGRHTT